LEIPRQRVTDLIKYTDRNVPALAQKKWAQLIETNPIAGWLDECLILSPHAKSYIGKDNPEESARWLYANFCKHQRESGHRGVLPVKRFSSNLRDLLKNQMKVSVEEGRDRNGAYIQGIGLRCFYDPNGTDYQRSITKGDCDNISEDCDGFEQKCDGLVTDETLTSVECDGCDGFLGNSEISEKNQEIAANEKISNQCCAGESEKNPSHSSHPAPVSVPTVTNPSQYEKNPSHSLQLAAKGEEDDWLKPENLQGMALSLRECEDAEALALVRGCWLPEAMNAACKLLSPEKHAQIMEWVVTLNTQADSDSV